ncbi:hypothetical protein [Enterococcus raffinosus]|uniref:Phage protein n=1 Tax=Enterococcus raffinosus TaxID=71452 RepID=A0AAW8TDQ9_9ENTE|nr:hypothetical protein [Enterococcus raffinosus]MDT2546769.1 hypothetical protein [Enterococcus raffinosus]
MNIWVSVNTDGFLTGYSLSEMPDMVEVDVENEPIDFSNWRLTNNQLIHDPENAPIVEEPISEVEKLKKENEELRQRVDMSDEALLELADMVLSATAAMKGGN